MADDLRINIKGETLSERAFAALKDAIFTGRLNPGDAIREIQFARMMDVSQATVREALAQLERVGLVVRQANRRTCVTSFTREEVKQRLEVRILLEEHAVAAACERMSDEDLRELRQLNQDLQKAIRAKDYYRNVLADMRFHRFTWDRCGNMVLSHTLEQLTTPLFAFLSVVHKRGNVDLRESWPHEAIVQALEARSPAQAREAIRRHVEGIYGGFLSTGASSLSEFVQTQSQPGEPSS